MFIIALTIAVIVAFYRIHEINRKINYFPSLDAAFGHLMRDLEKRISRLEARTPKSDTAAASTSGPEEVEIQLPAVADQPPAILEPIEASEPIRAAVDAQQWKAEEFPATAIEQPTINPVTEFIRSFSRKVREQIAGDEWEAIVGASWLNKAGVLVLVIGISLFLAHTLSYRGPMARIATGAFVSLAMLVGGVTMERRSRYVVFGRGLIGGGWAALYTTAYATYGFQSSRITDSPFIATMLLCLVAAGMIAHSIRYRSEAVTGLAYFVGFTTLVLGPMTSFALFASIPLVASLLYLSRRYRWESLALSGVVFTYASFLWSFPLPALSHPLFVSGQLALGAYWLMFECFDLSELIEGGARGRKAQALADLNALGFIGAAILQWLEYSPASLHIFLFYSAAAFAVSAALRWNFVPQGAPAPASQPLDPLAAGTFEGSLTIAVALMAGAIFRHFAGTAINLALLMEAEFLFLLGVRLGQAYVRALGGAIFAIAAAKVLLYDPAGADTIVIFHHAFLAWTPAAVLTVVVGYINRITFKGARLYGWAALFALCAVLAFEMDTAYVGLTWMAIGGCLAEYGLVSRDSDLRDQGYLAGAAGFGFLAILNGIGLPDVANPHPWISLIPATAMAYGASHQMMRSAGESISGKERLTLRDAASAAGTILAMLLAWQSLPMTAVAVAWMALAIILVEAGFATELPALRAEGYVVALLTCGRLYLANFDAPDYTGFLSHRLLTVAPIIASFYYLAQRLGEEDRRKPLEAIESHVGPMCLRIAALLVVTLIRFEAGRVNAVIGWAVFAVILLEAGLQLPNRDLRLQSYSIAIAAFLRSWSTNFIIPGSLGGMPQRVATGGFVIACLYACELLAPSAVAASDRAQSGSLEAALQFIDANARTMFSLLASTLLSMLLFYEISGNLLTVAWGVQAAALLVAGFALRERVLRHFGLGLFGLCLFKVFAYDLQQLSAMPRMASFIVLGAMLIGISFVYSRYQEQMRRYL
ncbi:MAG TPA: DUF2339 domain-containing protein [Candidatus Binataceae bacterium]|nr:DUF2339 domain-containing protein [Candidatus Binataceae bacterium]